jgi:UDP-GlcNAc:undecaprenyl-phosphate/decaprenyl-phosphate GlcNAc-1-phosphate transferase
VRRMRRGIGIAHADKEHIHHQLMLIGHGHRQAVLLMYLWSALLAGSALAIGSIDGRIAVGATLGCALILFLVTALPRLLAQRRNGSMEDARVGPPVSPDALDPQAPTPTEEAPARSTPAAPDPAPEVRRAAGAGDM